MTQSIFDVDSLHEIWDFNKRSSRYRMKKDKQLPPVNTIKQHIKLEDTKLCADLVNVGIKHRFIRYVKNDVLNVKHK